MDQDARDRLKALAKFLRELVPADQFHMAYYLNGSSLCVYQADIHDCGTVACAAGWATALFPPKPEHSTWPSYILDTFDVDANAADDSIWDWLFGSAWRHTDDTPRGAGARIEYFLEHGLPDNWEDQQMGGAPLCYVTT